MLDFAAIRSPGAPRDRDPAPRGDPDPPGEEDIRDPREKEPAGDPEPDEPPVEPPER